MSDPVEAAAVAAASTATAIANAEATTAAVVEVAQERIEEAQETAEKIAQAAIETSLGQRISAVEGTIEKWREENRQAIATVQGELAALTQSFLAKLEELAGKIPVVVPLPTNAQETAPSLSTLPAPEQPEIAPAAVIVPPQNAGADQEAAKTKVPARQRRWV